MNNKMCGGLAWASGVGSLLERPIGITLAAICAAIAFVVGFSLATKR